MAGMPKRRAKRLRRAKRRNPKAWTMERGFPRRKRAIRAGVSMPSPVIVRGDLWTHGGGDIYAYPPTRAGWEAARHRAKMATLVFKRERGVQRANPHPLQHFKRYFTPQATARLISDFADHATVAPRRRVLDARRGSRADRVANRRLYRAYAHVRASAEIRRHALRLPRVNPHRAGTDLQAARELRLYIDNNSRLYHGQFLPIVRNLMRRRAKGTYKHGLAAVAFRHLADAGAREYHREFGGPGKWSDTFSVATRNVVARELANSFRTEAGYGNYDGV